MSISDTAMAFFDACETGKGWDVCREWCHDDASFTCESGALADMKTLAEYTGWTQWLLGPIPDGGYDLKAFATDKDRGVVLAFSVFSGTQTGEGGPVPPTGNSAATNYVYAMEFTGNKISHMTKIWNDGDALAQLGWA